MKHKVEDDDRDFYEQKTAANTIKNNHSKKLGSSDSKSNFGSFTARNNNMTMLKTESKKNILDYSKVAKIRENSNFEMRKPSMDLKLGDL